MKLLRLGLYAHKYTYTQSMKCFSVITLPDLRLARQEFYPKNFHRKILNRPINFYNSDLFSSYTCPVIYIFLFNTVLFLLPLHKDMLENTAQSSYSKY